MYMIDLPLDAAALTRFAWRQGHAGGRNPGDEDFGYAAHAWLVAILGEQAPRPFRLMETRTGLRLLGYAAVGADARTQHACEFSLPDAFAVCDWSAAAGKALPATWATGRHLGFEVRACPIVRGERERDAYLVEVDQAKAEGREPAGRTQVYIHWLQRQLERDGAARAVTETLNLVGFRRVRALRQSRIGQRHRGLERPDALMTGELVVGDPDAFARLLVRGIGRHRAFGFGMLLLRPACGRAA
jgi:CRISPR system Cascade subunit CasE